MDGRIKTIAAITVLMAICFASASPLCSAETSGNDAVSSGNESVDSSQSNDASSLVEKIIFFVILGICVVTVAAILCKILRMR